MNVRLSVIASLAATVLGCGGADDPSVVLYKSTGSLQCTSSQTTQARLSAEIAALRDAGVSVLASGCANDGLPRIALCGVDNGDLFSVTVTPSTEAPATRLGYKPAAHYPSARTMACQ